MSSGAQFAELTPQTKVFFDYTYTAYNHASNLFQRPLGSSFIIEISIGGHTSFAYKAASLQKCIDEAKKFLRILKKQAAAIKV